MRVLIADNDFNNVEDAASIIIQCQPDWTLTFVNSARECLNILKNGNYHDVAILSAELPDMFDFKLIEQIREHSDIPVIVISPKADIFRLVKAFDAGASDYIEKPFNKKVLIARLKASKRRREWDIQAQENELSINPPEPFHQTD